MRCMHQALDENDRRREARGVLAAAFAQLADHMRNQPPQQ